MCFDNLGTTFETFRIYSGVSKLMGGCPQPLSSKTPLAFLLPSYHVRSLQNIHGSINVWFCFYNIICKSAFTFAKK